MKNQSKPTISPAVLVLVMGFGGVACLAAAQFVPGPMAAHVEAFGALLLGWAFKRPGDLSATTHPDDA